MMSWKLFGVAFVLGVIGGVSVWYFGNNSHTDMVHYHAGFQAYDGGDVLDFSGPEFMYLGECGTMGHSFTSVQDRVHLHERIGDVAHIHDTGVTWRDLLVSLRQEEYLDAIDTILVEEEVRGREVLDRVIEPYERVIFVANQSEIDPELLWEGMISVDYIREVEEKSLNCNPV